MTVAPAVLVLAAQVSSGIQTLWDFQYLGVSALSTSVVSLLASQTKNDYNDDCSCLTLVNRSILSMHFFPLEWLINYCFPMLLNSKFIPHTVHLALYLSLSTHASHWLNKSSLRQEELKTVCLLIFHLSSSTMLTINRKRKKSIVQSINYHRSTIHIKITTESLLVKDAERKALQQIVR